MNFVSSFNKYNIFSFLAAGFCPKNLAFAWKMMGLNEYGGLQPSQPPGSYACVSA